MHALVTGATSGIGEAIARGLATAGLTVVVAGRNEAKGRSVIERIAAESGNDRLHSLSADLSSVAGARSLAAGYRDRFDRLDVLVNNAGGMFARRRASVDGFEMTLALNHLGPFVLTTELLDLLTATAAAHPERGARIVNVSSDSHRSGIVWDDLQSERRYSMNRAYGQSKALNVLFTQELARRLEGSGVTVNALHPGVVRTSIMANSGMPLGGALYAVLGRFIAVPPERGADTALHLALSDAVQGATGGYYIDRQQREPAGALGDAEELWRLSEGWGGG